ncbi:YciI family protein [Kitasatospora sp. NPDC092039]|uniref:YciI family protein n=1 Tax=Kitasatospora sp. NPDC092039 TaxID=3364086 RepID=UPI003801C854
MKYMLLIHMNPVVWDGLSERERNEVFAGHATFQQKILDSGEMVVTQALADPSGSATVRVRAGRPAVSDGPYLAGKEFLAGYYLVECASRERAIELAGLIPDARYTGIEVRQVVFEADTES